MITKRGKTFWMRRRVPSRFAQVNDAAFVHMSLRTDSQIEAQEKAAAIWAELEMAWEARLRGASGDAESRYQAARDLAQMRGFRYRRVAQVADLPLDEILERIEAVPDRRGAPDPVEAAALLGGAAVPEISLSRALDLYWPIARGDTLGMSGDQVRRWRNPKIKAIKNLIEVIGDVDIAKISGDDMLDFRDWWIDRIENEGLTQNSANKDITHISVILKTVAEKKRLGFTPPVSGLRLRGGRSSARVSVGADWVRDRLLPGLDGINDEARDVILMMVNTGLRPSEIVGLLPDHFQLSGNIPHVQIRGDGKRLKTQNSERDMPLVGVSLEAARRRAVDGFPAYRGKATISATVNKYLRENKLLPSGASLYGLRHGFEDRLLQAGVDERVRRDLMGHALTRQRYGDGGGLALRLDAVQRILI